MLKFGTLHPTRITGALGVSRHQARSFALLATTFIVLLLIDLAACGVAMEVVDGTRVWRLRNGRSTMARP
jgi:hypothetical protein